MKQLRKRFNEEEVKELLKKYEDSAVKLEIICDILGVARAQFFRLLKQYRQNELSLSYKLTSINQSLEKEHNNLILCELKEQLKLIQDNKIPIYRYNYSYAQQAILRKYNVKISRQTIVNRAKDWGYYKSIQKSKTPHDRFVATNNIGELIQHDSSHHLFAPYANVKWYLITSIDDFSRLMLEACFIESESSIEHIKSLERVFTHHGFPLAYYSDNHSIFRFIAGCDENLLHINKYIETDGVDTQWLQVLKECNVKQRYALSPRSKGKIVRPITTSAFTA